MTSERTVATAAVLMTLGLAAVSWVVAVRQMDGMETGGTGLGSLVPFVAVWVWMMAAMMLPGAAPAVWRHAHASGRVGAVPLFVPLALAIVGLGILIVLAPSSVPGLMPPM